MSLHTYVGRHISGTRVKLSTRNWLNTMQYLHKSNLIEAEGASQQSLEAQLYAEEVECDWFGRSDDEYLSDEYVYSTRLQI